MTLSLEHEQFRESLRRYIEQSINPNIDEWEQAQMMPLHEIISDMAKYGFIGLEYDPEFNGQGVDHLFTMVLAEELGHVNNGAFPMAFGSHVAMATPSLHAHGSKELKQQFLAPAMTGEMVAAVAVTEPDAGSDVSALRTTAKRDGNDWVISGSKMYITNSLQADWICLLARTSEDSKGYAGMSQIIVPTPIKGLEIQKLKKLGMHASDTGILHLDAVRVPVSNTIGEIGRGFQQQMSQFVMERMFACYSMPVVARVALDRTKDYASERKVFGKPLTHNQHLAYTFADLAAQTDLIQVYNRQIALDYLAGQNVTKAATVSKLKGARLVREIADWCLQVHGGMGYMEECWTARFLRDQRLLSIGGGADEVMLRVLSQMEGFTD